MENKKNRTCAYCRVSTASDTQDGSFEVQCEYYERLMKHGLLQDMATHLTEKTMAG